jgi:RNA polymerase sigma factor, sigma-70 family
MLFFTFSDNEKRKTRETEDETVERHYTEILAYCRYHLNFDNSAAEECTQEVFTAFFEHTTYSGIYNPRAWLYRTADNYINQYKRAVEKQKSTTFTLPDEEDDNNRDKDDKFVYNQDFDHYLDGNIDVERFKKEILSSLNGRESKLFNLYFREHVSIKQLSERYAISDNAVSKRINRIRIKIKKEIGNLNLYKQ